MLIPGSAQSPVINPAFIVSNWNSEDANVLVNGKPAKDARVGINHKLEGNNLIVFLFLEKNEPVNVTLVP